jgi:hypothetical protein
MTGDGRSRAPRALVSWGIGISLIRMLLAEPVQAQILEIDALFALKASRCGQHAPRPDV